MNSQTPIVARNVSKSYEGFEALSRVSLEARQGEVFGVIGPNGAGKTTLVEILEGLRTLDSGMASVLGHDVTHDLTPVKARMGVAMQSTTLPPLLTAFELADLYAAIYPNSREPNEVLELVGLSEKRDERTARLSGGQRQRLAMALAVIGRPEVLFLDEPTSELDPQGRHVIWDLIKDSKTREDRTVLITTHQMEEAQTLCDRVAVIDHGKVIALGSPDALIDQYCPGQEIEFEARPGSDLALLQPLAKIVSLEEDQGKIRVSLWSDEIENALEGVLELRRSGVLVSENLRVKRGNLEGVFLELTGRELRD